MANQVDYRDPTPNNFPNDYDESKVDPRVKLRSKSINEKMNGADVRGALAQGLEIAGVVATEAAETASAADAKSTDTQNRLKDQLAAATDANDDLSEITDAKRPANAIKAYKTIGERMDATDTEGVKFNKQLLSLARRNYRNNLSYKTISSTLYTDGTINDDKLTRIYNTGADLALVVMATINNTADPHPVAQDDSRVLDVINRAKVIGLKTTMLKPHIGLVNQYDSFYRGNYDPSDYAAFFENWQTILLNYADICDKNNIPILCIGCEQDKCTAPMYIGNWATIIAAIKAKYPNLKLTYAMSATEYLAVDSNGQIAQFVDYVGLNAYPIYLQRLFDQNVTTEELITAWYQDADNRKTMDIIDKYATIYGKSIFITETGITPYSDGLARLVSNNRENLNFDAQAAAYQATFEAIAQNANIIGLSIWNTNAPFNFYNDATTTTSEQILTDYFKGGKI